MKNKIVNSEIEKYSNIENENILLSKYYLVIFLLLFSKKFLILSY